MSNFDTAIKVVLEHEGFYSNDKFDPGGATKYGVSLTFLKSMESTNLDLADVNNDGMVTIEDIRSLTLEEAIDIYKYQWWDRYKYEEILDSKIATKIFDLSVNMGAVQAHKLVQRALKLKDDGILGEKSFAAINETEDVDKLINAISDQAVKFYITITKSRIQKYGLDEGIKYLLGWIRRACNLN